MYFPHIFIFKAIRNPGTQQVGRSTERSMYMYLNLFCNIPDILRYTWAYSATDFNELIGGELGASQKVKTKVFMVYDWKEDTYIEEEKGKAILDLLSVIYDFEEKKNHS